MGVIRPAVWLLMLLLAAGCGGGGSSSGNAAAPRLNDAHEPGWRTTHDSAYSKDAVRCWVCHGEDYRGSGEVVSCFSCHAGGPPFVLHPASPAPDLPWSHPVNHGSAARRDIAACQGCHGRPGGPGSNPPFDVALRNLTQGCQTIPGCHNPGTAHPAKVTDPTTQDQRHWYGEVITYRSGGVDRTYAISHFDAGNVPGACTLCHGANYGGGSGPACTACHVTSPVAQPRGCVSCHGGPPAGGYTEFAQRSGRPELTDPTHPGYNQRFDFLTEVRSGKHLKHEGMACRDYDESAECRRCHDGPVDELTAPDGGPLTDAAGNRVVNTFDLHHPGFAASVSDGTINFLDCARCHFPGSNFLFFRDAQGRTNCEGCHDRGGVVPIFPERPCP